MNAFKRRALLGALGLSCLPLTGCLTLIKIISIDELRKFPSVPADRQFAYREAKDGYGTVVIGRQYVLVGSGCYFGVYVDGYYVGRIDTKEQITLHLPPGEHVIKVGADQKGRALCSPEAHPNGALSGKSLETIVRAGQTKFFQCYVDAGTQTYYEFMRIDS